MYAADRERHHPGPRARASPDDREQPERRHRLGEDLRRAGAGVGRGAEDRQLEHRVRERHAGERAGDLGQRRMPGAPRQGSPPWLASASVTAGLRCAPETGPKARISATSAPPVASEFASSASATFPPASRSPMIPEPTTATSSSAVPQASATARRESPLTGAPFRRCGPLAGGNDSVRSPACSSRLHSSSR